MSSRKAREAQRHRERNARLRRELIAGYGGVCACCGEGVPEFLGIDHIDGHWGYRTKSGARLRGCKLYGKLIAEGFPAGYRLLCHNCNLSLGIWGYCPHGLTSNGRRSGRAPASPDLPSDQSVIVSL